MNILEKEFIPLDIGYGKSPFIAFHYGGNLFFSSELMRKVYKIEELENVRTVDLLLSKDRSILIMRFYGGPTGMHRMRKFYKDQLSCRFCRYTYAFSKLKMEPPVGKKFEVYYNSKLEVWCADLTQSEACLIKRPVNEKNAIKKKERDLQEKQSLCSQT